MPSATYSEFLITSNFTALSEAWLPTHSQLKFSDHIYDFDKDYGTIIFAEFEQGVFKTENCKQDCSNQKYVLRVRHEIHDYYSAYKIKEEVIIT